MFKTVPILPLLLLLQLVPLMAPAQVKEKLEVLTFQNSDAERQSDRPEGPVSDFWRLWSEKTGIEIDLKVDSFKNIFERVAAGEGDVIGGMFYTRERSVYFDYSLPIMQLDTYIYFHQNVLAANTIKDLAGYRVGVMDGDYSQQFLTREVPDAMLVTYQDPEILVGALLNQEVNFAVLDEVVMIACVKKLDKPLPIRRAAKPVYSKNIHACVQKGRTDLLDQINQGIQMVSLQERDAISQNWSGVALNKDQHLHYWLLGLGLSLACIGLVILWNRQLSHRIKEATLSLAQSEKRYRTIFDAAQDGIIVVDHLSGKVLDMNSRARSMFCYEKHEINGLNIGKLVMEGGPACGQELSDMMTRLQTGGPFSFESRTHNRMGKMFWTEVSVGIGNFEDEPCLLMIVRDISERKQAEKQIIALNKELEDRVQLRTKQLEVAQKELVTEAHRAGMADITSNMLHNVGNILTSVTTTAHVLQDNLENSKVGTALLNAAQLIKENMGNLEQFLLEDSRGRRLFEFFVSLEQRYQRETALLREDVQRLIDKIKAIQDVVVAQQSYASGVSHSEPLNINTIIGDGLAMEDRNNQKAGIRVQFEAKKLPAIRAQKAKLIHVIVNLVKNAREAMEQTRPDQKILDIQLGQEGAWIFARFRDYGHGIEPQHMEQIFTHGFTTKAKGHGFGLHSCANYIGEIGGKIRVEVPEEGPGTVFCLYFPLAGEAKEALTDEEKPGETAEQPDFNV